MGRVFSEEFFQLIRGHWEEMSKWRAASLTPSPTSLPLPPLGVSVSQDVALSRRAAPARHRVCLQPQ